MAKSDPGQPVHNVRNGPQAKDDSGAVLERGSVTIDVKANDLAQNASSLWSLNQGSPGSYTAPNTAITLDSGASVSFVDGKVVYDAGTAFDYLDRGEVAFDTFTYSIRMANGTISYATVTVQVTGTNADPDAVDDALTVSESGTTTLAVLANDSDSDGDALSIVGFTQPAEGTIAFDSSGNLVFDAGDLFAGLSAGQHAEVSFDYTVSDGHGGTDTATATLTVAGEGTFAPTIVSDSASGTLANGQTVNITLSGEGQTNDSQAPITVNIGLGAVAQPQINIVYVVDTSGSTQNPFPGTPVGDINTDGAFNRIIDAELASLLNLTAAIQALGFPPDSVSLTVVPFSGTANPSSTNDPVATFDIGDTAGLTAYFGNIDQGGQTNYTAALQTVQARLAALDPAHNETNLVYFLSDGLPNIGATTFQAVAQTLWTTYNAQISAIGIGASTLTALNQLDNTGGAQAVTSTNQLDAALLGSPIPSGEVIDFQVFVDGTEVATIDETDLVSSVLGFSFDVTLDDLSPYLGDSSHVSAVITFTGGVTLDVAIDIAGVMPDTWVM